jgi:phosphatidylglycerophosphatase A
MNRLPRSGVLIAVAWTAATWFGCGLVPIAPGTAGTLGAIPLYLLVSMHGHAGVAAAALAATVLGIWTSSVVARELGLKDPQVVVIDEVAGFLVTMLPVPHPSWRTIVAGFVLFRALDVTKPWPVRRFEGLLGGWGIVMDDVAAGVIGAAVMASLLALGVLT